MLNDPESTHAHATVRVDASRRSPLRRIWRYAGYDEPNYTYTPNGRALLAKLGGMDDAPYFIRAHFLLCTGSGEGRPKFGSSNIYTEDAQGNPVYSFDIIDRIFDAYLETGCVPFVEIGFMPQALSTAPADVQYDAIRAGGWAYPPRDYGRWQELVRVLAEHLLGRYGLREVSRWYWELWNEPDLSTTYWKGTIPEYCRLYDHTVAGLTAVLPQARVGGPATTQPSRPDAGHFLRSFLDHCVHGANAVTGQTGTRLDFISFHTKGARYTVQPLATKHPPTIHSLYANASAGLAIASEFPELAHKEVILSECDPDGWAAGSKYDNPNLQYRNTEYYAAYIAESAAKFIDLETPALRVDGMLTWAFQFENREYFEGLRTLSTNGIDKAALNVFRLLGKLGGMRVHLESDAARNPLDNPEGDPDVAPPDLSGIAAIGGAGEVRAFLVTHHDDWDVCTPTKVSFEVAGLQSGMAYRMRRYLIDASHSNAYGAWEAMGSPQQPTPAQRAALEQAARLALAEECDLAPRNGNLALELTLAAQAVCLVELVPA